MPSLVSFLLHGTSNSSTKNDSNNMIEHPSDHNDSENQNDNINNQRSRFLTRQFVTFDDNWMMKNSKNPSKFSKSLNQGEATLLDTEPDEIQISSPAINMVDNNQESNSIDTFSPDELDINTQTIPKTESTSPTKTNRFKSPIHTSTLPTQKTTNIETRRSISKSQSISHSPALTKIKQPISSPTTNEGAFIFFTSSIDRQNNSLSKDDRKRITSSDDDDIETNNLKEDDLKLKLKKEKQHGKRTGELLNKLHENYEELLEKYAHAENTIDQLRFQPKIFGDNTPRSTTSEHTIHLTQQSKVNPTTLRSSGAYRSTTGSPLSSIRPVNSTTTTTTTPARKSISPANSGTIESVIFDEITPRQDTFKLELLIQTKALEDKMKSFLTLMDANQLSLAEQRQVYETIKQDYEKLLKIFDEYKRDIDLDADLNKELDNMKQLLKEIVKRITQNLLGKSVIESSSDQQIHDESHSSHQSIRSSLCNHNDLMNQYKKLLNAVKEPKKSVSTESETDSKKFKSNVSDHQSSINKKQKSYVYVSGDSDDEPQQNNDIAPIPYTKGIESTSFELDYIPSTSVKHHSHKIEDQIHKKIRTENLSRYPNNRTYDYDSGIGTNNLTKLSYDSKLYTSTMDESHFQSLDDEQELISSSNSSGSNSESPGSPYRNKFNNQSSYRTKPSGYSKVHQSDIERHLAGGSFDLPRQSSSYKKNMHRSYHIWKPQKSTISHRSRLTPIYRSTTIANPSIEDYKIKSFHPLNTPQISSKIKTNYRQIQPPTYRSSIYINEPHTNKINENLYLDSQTGIIYRYEPNKTENSPRIYYQSPSRTKFYRCTECGTINTRHHRHHIEQVPTYSDDLGYESDYKKKHRRYRYKDYSSSSSSSSDTDSTVSSTYLELAALNQAYNRAERIQQHSRCLSRYIVRQIKLALTTL